MFDRKNQRSHVAWDIETTGFNWNDEITVSGFWFPAGHATLLLNAETITTDSTEYEERLEAIKEGLDVRVHVCEGEPDLLRTMHDVVFDQIESDYNRLIAFNAETWKSGFDLPFLRTRCIKHDVSWLFSDLQFADLWEPVKKRLNTTHTTHGTSMDINSLTGAHELLFAQTIPTTFVSETNHPWYCTTEYDPFDDSSRAVNCYNRGDYLPILQHNLADVHRTWELGELVRAFVSPKDITDKKL